MTSTRRNNVVLIVLDSVRKDHLSCYGHHRETTPNIDRIAREGIRYSNAFANACWTLPSHVSMFTGLYPSQHRADLDTGILDQRLTTLASTLGAAGYATASFSCNGFVSPKTGLTRGFDVSVDVEGLLGGSDGLVNRLTRSIHRRLRQTFGRDRGARRATRSALDWLGSVEKDRPFFLFINYMECHLPYRVRGERRYQFVEREARRRADAVPQDPFATMAGAVSLSRGDLTDLKKLYDGCLRYLDEQVGILDQRLRELGRDEDTIFVVTSDHGESFGEHGLLDHQYGLYDHLLHVPLIIRTPGGAGGTVEERLVQHVWLMPFLQYIASGGDPIEWPRRPARVENAGTPVGDAVYAEYLVPNVRQFRRRFPDLDIERYNVALRSIRTERFKLICRGDGANELFDLATDPEERRNLSAIRLDVVHELKGRLERELGEWPTLRSSPEAEAGLEEVEERLAALGYI